MRVFFEEGVVREVCSAEVKPMDVGGGKVVGTEIEFVKQLYTYGMADFSDQPAELM